MDIKEILRKFPCIEQSHIWEDHRSFFVQQADEVIGEGTVLVEFFQHRFAEDLYLVSGKEYEANDASLLGALEDRFGTLNGQLNEAQKKTFVELKDNETKVKELVFDDQLELYKLQVEKSSDGLDPSRLEHFTDWIQSYATQTNVWATRYPAGVYLFACLSDDLSFDEEEKCIKQTKFVLFGEKDDPVEYQYWIKLVFSQYLDVRPTVLPHSLSDEWEECQVYFSDGDRAIDPTELDDEFDAWYRHLVLEEDPFQGDEEEE